jgi:ketosteroid isomerase-like protein
MIKRRIETVFHDIGRRDLSRVLPSLATNVHHRFAGDHALGGERHSREGVSRWFERLFRLFPELTFSVHSVHAAGWPWRLTVTAEWTARAVPAAGDTYENRGAHVLRIERGKVTHLHAYEDSQAVAHACDVMAAAGIEEATVPPINS